MFQEYQQLRQLCEAKQVSLVAVSKQQSVAKILQLYQQGQREFAENYGQELLAKVPLLPEDIHWHFIGHLQTNKVKSLLPVVTWIQSVDSLKLYAKIRQHIHLRTKPINLLLQVHVAQEAHKFGFSPASLPREFAQIEPHPLMRLRGIMGMASLTEDQAQIRAEFDQLYRLFCELRSRYQSQYPDFQLCSMGMSMDYRLALEAGSNMLRIGSLIFGAR